jgi:hypothetical protein
LVSTYSIPPYKRWGSVAELTCHSPGSTPYEIKFSHKNLVGLRRPRMSLRASQYKGIAYRGVYNKTFQRWRVLRCWRNPTLVATTFQASLGGRPKAVRRKQRCRAEGEEPPRMSPAQRQRMKNIIGQEDEKTRTAIAKKKQAEAEQAAAAKGSSRVVKVGH